MLITVLFLLFAMFLLYISGEFLIRGSVLLANKFNLNSFFIGATVVAFGTSAPEFFVSLFSKIQGSNSITLGNILGSNIANIGIVLATSLIFAKISKKQVNNNFAIPKLELILILLTPIFLLLSICTGSFNFYLSIILFVLFVYFLSFSIKNNIKLTDGSKVLEDTKNTTSNLLIVILILLGIIGLPFSAKLFIKEAKQIALLFGVSEMLIGVTITAFGTSLPEFVASIIAITKNDAQMSIGNVLGSNIINFYGILGGISIFMPVNVLKNSILELITLSVFTIVILNLSKIKNKISGIFLLFGYLIYIYFVIIRT